MYFELIRVIIPAVAAHPEAETSCGEFTTPYLKRLNVLKHVKGDNSGRQHRDCAQVGVEGLETFCLLR